MKDKNANSDRINILKNIRKVLTNCFNDYSFIKLFLAHMTNRGYGFIKIDNLKYDLYIPYNKEEYKILFENTSIKERNDHTLNVDKLIKNAIKYGLINKVSSDSTGKRSIMLSDDDSDIIMSEYAEIYNKKMASLVDYYLKNKSIAKTIDYDWLKDDIDIITFNEQKIKEKRNYYYIKKMKIKDTKKD